MAEDLDRGHGDEAHFDADDLEKLYRQGGLDIAQNIQGSSLNRVLGVTTYDPDAWYVVTQDGVKPL